MFPILSCYQTSSQFNESENYQIESKFDRVSLTTDFDTKVLRVK